MAISSANAACACLPPACQLSWAILSAVQRYSKLMPPPSTSGALSPSATSVECAASPQMPSLPPRPHSTPACHENAAQWLLFGLMLPPTPAPTTSSAQTTGGGLSPSSPMAQLDSPQVSFRFAASPTPIATGFEGSLSSAVRSYARGITSVDRIDQIERLSRGITGLTAKDPRHQRRLSSSAVLSGQPPRAPKANIAEQFAGIKPRSNMRGRSHSFADLTSATIPDNVRLSPAYSPNSQFGIPSVARYVEGSSNHGERSFYSSPVAGVVTSARSSSYTEPAMSIANCGRRPPSPKLSEHFKSFAGNGRGLSRRVTSM